MTRFTAAMLQVLGGLPNGQEWLTPADVWRAAADALPSEHPPVHNDLAWAHRQPWVKNRRYAPPPRSAVPLSHLAGDRGLDHDPIPEPPGFYAKPRYLSSHAFLGRAGQLETLDDWAAAAQPHPVLLFEAIGGTGKSLLTWEWVTSHATTIRADWAGRFWYSFYEIGATMSDFCRRAVAYMTGRSLAELRDVKQATLADVLLLQLRSKPWLVVLDGLERILVAYHRHDASQLPDDTAGRIDEVADRDPCSAIRPGDDELLRQLTAAAPSKVLITSRLTPRVLLNAANQPIPGVLVERLPGLRPQDAEAMLRSAGVNGDAYRIQDFLQRHCDCHPLVTGIVAGLVNAYLPARGDFDQWAADPAHGGRLDLGGLDLVQKRNHILLAALDNLPDASDRLLSSLSLLPDAVDYTTLRALNPHRPPGPERVAEPYVPDSWYPESPTPDQPLRHHEDHARSMAAWREYQRHYAEWESSRESKAATDALYKTVDDLERRGLLQYERSAGRWDLHPVVRATVRARLTGRDRDRLGQQIIDHFSQQSRHSYEAAETLNDLHAAFVVIQTMIQIERFDEAAVVLNEVCDALLFRFEAYPEVVALARPMLGQDWSAPVIPVAVNPRLIGNATYALHRLGLHNESERLTQLGLAEHINLRLFNQVRVDLSNLGVILYALDRIALAGRYFVLGLQLAETGLPPEHLLAARLVYMGYLGEVGRWTEAEQVWQLIEPMDRDVPTQAVRRGQPEITYLEYVLFPNGRLTHEALANAESLAAAGRNRLGLRKLHILRGRWQLLRHEPADAVDAFQEAVRMANEAGFPDLMAEAHLALALLRSRPHDAGSAYDVARRLSAAARPPHQALAELWQALDNTSQAVAHARAAYTRAWADGEPHVRRYALMQAEAALRTLGARAPELLPYDPANHPVQDLERRAADLIAERPAESYPRKFFQ